MYTHGEPHTLHKLFIQQSKDIGVSQLVLRAKGKSLRSIDLCSRHGAAAADRWWRRRFDWWTECGSGNVAQPNENSRKALHDWNGRLLSWSSVGGPMHCKMANRGCEYRGCWSREDFRTILIGTMGPGSSKYCSGTHY